MMREREGTTGNGTGWRHFDREWEQELMTVPSKSNFPSDSESLGPVASVPGGMNLRLRRRRCGWRELRRR